MVPKPDRRGVGRLAAAPAVRGAARIVVQPWPAAPHGPIKALGVDAGVNVTIGLPVIRTSVDHGTAFDIAGTGAAEEASMREALRQAVELAGGLPSRRHDPDSA